MSVFFYFFFFFFFNLLWPHCWLTVCTQHNLCQHLQNKTSVRLSKTIQMHSLFDFQNVSTYICIHMVVLSRWNENTIHGIILLASVASASSCYYVNCGIINRAPPPAPEWLIFPSILKHFLTDKLFDVQQLIRCINYRFVRAVFWATLKFLEQGPFQ